MHCNQHIIKVHRVQLQQQEQQMWQVTEDHQLKLKVEYNYPVKGWDIR